MEEATLLARRDDLAPVAQAEEVRRIAEVEVVVPGTRRVIEHPRVVGRALVHPDDVAVAGVEGDHGVSCGGCWGRGGGCGGGIKSVWGGGGGRGRPEAGGRRTRPPPGGGGHVGLPHPPPPPP